MVRYHGLRSCVYRSTGGPLVAGPCAADGSSAARGLTTVNDAMLLWLFMTSSPDATVPALSHRTFAPVLLTAAPRGCPSLAVHGCSKNCIPGGSPTKAANLTRE